MSKILNLLLYFFKEIIFEHKDEHDFQKKEFNTRKMVVCLLLIISFATNILFLERIYKLAITNIGLRGALIGKEIPICGKNMDEAPSDSGNDAKIKSTPPLKKTPPKNANDIVVAALKV